VKSVVNFWIRPGLVLSGQVQDSAGQALKDATLQVFLAFDKPTPLLSHLTISNQNQGAFSFNALPQGWAYEIRATAPGYEKSTVQVPAGKTQTELLELPPIKLKFTNSPNRAGDVFSP
jgi:Carboxypeptidase regulatory-like domain